MHETIAEPLLYGSKQMDPKPLNLPLEDIVLALRGGSPVVAQLEPGDGTHYCLLIVPAWADGVSPHLGRYGIRQTASRDYLIVTYLQDTHGHTFYAFRDGTFYAFRDGMEAWDIDNAIKNAWTRQVFIWWFNMLWRQL